MNFEEKTGRFELSYASPERNGKHFPQFDTQDQICRHYANYDDYHYESTRDTSSCTNPQIERCLYEFEDEENIDYVFAKLQENHNTYNTQRVNPDDIILYNDDIFYIECKSKPLIECRPFLQLINGRSTCREQSIEQNITIPTNEYFCIAKGIHDNQSDISGSFVTLGSSRPQPKGEDFIHKCRGISVLVSYETILDPTYIKQMIDQ